MAAPPRHYRGRARGDRARTWPRATNLCGRLGRLPNAKAGTCTETDWQFAVDCAGRFLDEWGAVASGFGWQASDVFGSGGLAWFCAGERVRALGPDNAVTSSGRIFARRAPGDG